MTSVAQKPTAVSTYDLETGATTYNLPAMDAGQRWRCAISQATEAARKRFPHSNERIEKAYELVTTHKVTLHPATHDASVQSSDGERVYRVNGTCECPDQRAPESYCKHRLAVCILRKAVKLVGEWKTATAPVTVQPEAMDPEAVEAETGEPETETGEPETETGETETVTVLEAEVMPSTPRIPREFLYERQGSTAILWGGLLHMAHEAGMHRLEVEVITVTADFALMRATAHFNDGGVWSDIGDASPSNVGRRITPHFVRMASTRAMARCLRLALDIPYVCAVELADD